MLRIGQMVADVSLKTTVGDFGVHEYFGGSWGLLVCYVADFSAVCTDELSRLVKDFHEFESRGIKILAMSCDSIDSHTKWIEPVTDCLVSSKVPKDEIEKKFPSATVIELPSGKDYMRIVPKIEVNKKYDK
eukprot:XP_016661415.1 PREDICTED: 1-Cys peroxiredoxin PER1-like [Acyrthosiphon pisum]